MEWHDEGLMIGVLPYGDHHGVAHLLTAVHGHARGMVYGRRKAGALLPGTLVNSRWRARLADQLGAFTLEAQTGAGAPPGFSLLLLGSACRLLYDLLPIGLPYPRLYQLTVAFVTSLPHVETRTATAQYLWWEFQLLGEVGYALDITTCALTGQTHDLAFVSPNTGRAASKAAAAPYASKLLPLPSFLQQAEPPLSPPPHAALADAFSLNGHFLHAWLYAPMGKKMPMPRQLLRPHVQQLAA
jgi:DNA repair protein RecO (recombination protein O)